MSILTVLLLAATPPAPAIRSEKIGATRYRVVVAAPGLTLEQGQARAGAEAKRLCGGASVTFGQFRWQSEEMLETAEAGRTAVSLTLEQEVDCAAPPPPVVGKPTGWKPGPADVKTVMDLTARYFEARDRGRYREAWSLLTPTMQEISPLARWQAAHKAFNDRAGGGLRRAPVKLTWYDNPPNAPVAGIFAAVDFVGKADKLQIICGYLMWLRQGDGSWRLTRDEEGSIEDKPGVTSSVEQVAQAKAAMGCAEPE
jgi:hypothetical protein